MATSEVERILDDWATAWSSHDTAKVLALFTDGGHGVGHVRDTQR